MGERVYAQIYRDGELIDEKCVGKLNYYLHFYETKSNLVLLDIVTRKLYEREREEDLLKIGKLVVDLYSWQWGTFDLDITLDWYDMRRYLEAACDDIWTHYYDESDRKKILEIKSRSEWEYDWRKDFEPFLTSTHYTFKLSQGG